MHVTGEIAAMREVLGSLPRPLGFVPTMGALHAGHVRLVEVARSECASVAASIFVNPKQFSPTEDLAKYPRDLAGDGEKLRAAGVDALFVPNETTIYPPGFSTTVEVGAIGKIFEGAARPQHFAGVATVVTKLLHVVQPDVLFLGQKDAQQTVVLRKLVRDLAFGVKVRVVPTVRENDGLALSSRNAYLGDREREVAPNLYHALQAIEAAMAAGATKADAVAAARLPDGFAVEYFDVVDAETFDPLDRLGTPAFIIGAARLGATRLIDSILVAA